MTWTYKPHLNLMIQIQFSVKKVGGGWGGRFGGFLKIKLIDIMS